MIGRICGTLLEKQAPELLVDVQGVGYELLVSMNTFFTLPSRGDTVTLYTHFVVREDAQLLYGFTGLDERSLFRHLIKVTGVGPKMALAILSGMTAGEFVRCVHTGDLATLTRLPGVGKKTAERLLVEMKDRLANWQDGDGAHSSSVEPGGIGGVAAEAESALQALGYKPQEAARMIAAARKELGGDAIPSEMLIRTALRQAVKK